MIKYRGISGRVGSDSLGLDPQSSVAAAVPKTPDSAARQSLTLATVSVVSRLTGGLRTTAIGAALGGKAMADSYAIAMLLPSVIYAIAVGSMLSTVLVPLLVQQREREPGEADVYTHRLFGGVTALLGTIALLSVLGSPLLVLIAADAATQAMTQMFCYFVLPLIVGYGVTDMLRAVLNSRGRFVAPAWAQVVYNLVLTAAAVVVIMLPAPDHLTPGNAPPWIAPVLGLATVLGAIVEIAILMFASRRVGFRWRWRWDFHRLPLRKIGRMGLWSLCYATVNQLSNLVLAFLTTRAGVQGAAGFFIFSSAYLLMMAAYSLVVVSIVTVLVPRLSAAAGRNDLPAVAETVARGARLSVAILVPIAVCYVVLAEPIAIALLQWGRFDAGDATASSVVIRLSAFVLLPLSISELFIFTFWSLPDVRTPTLVSIPVVTTRIAVNVGLFMALPASAVAGAMMGGLAASYLVDIVLTGWLLRRRLPDFSLRRLAAASGRIILAGFFATVSGLLVLAALARWIGLDKAGSIATIVSSVIVVSATYVTTAKLLGAKEPIEVFKFAAKSLIHR